MPKILVIRFSSLGDVVLTAPVFAALRAAYPEAKITALVKESFAQVLQSNPNIDDVIAFRPGQSLAWLIGEVRRRRFDLLIDLHGSLRSRWVSLWSGARRKVRYAKAAWARRLYVGWRVPSPELRRHTLERYLATLQRLDPRLAERLPEAAPFKILVIQTAFLGDAVLTTPLVRALRDRYPQGAISLLCTPETAEIFRRQPDVSDVIIFDKRGSARSLPQRWALIRKLGRMGFDLAVIPHRSLTSALVAALAGIPRRVGFSTSQGRRLLTDRVPFRWDVHDVERNLALLRPLGVEHPRAELSVRASPEAMAKVSARLIEAGVADDASVVGVNAGSVWATKRWLPERFAAVADKLQRDPALRVVFFGGPKDRAVMDEVRRHMTSAPIDWVGKTDLGELIAGILRCQAFLTNDSGPMHIAVAGNVPTVAIFGPTTRELGFFPYGPGHRVIERDLECRPCGLHGGEKCPLGHFRCMNDVGVDEVYQAVVDQLSSHRCNLPSGRQDLPSGRQGRCPDYENPSTR